MRASIYLAGPVEDSDDPYGWRDEVDDRFGYINFINPMDLADPSDSPEYIWSKCIMGLRKSDGIIVNLNNKEFTWGTPIEQYVVYDMSKPVVVVTEFDDDELPSAAVVYSDKRTSKYNKAIRYIDKWG